MRATSRLGRLHSLLIVSVAVGLPGCTEDFGTSTQTVPLAAPTTVAGLPPPRAAFGQATAAPVQTAQAAQVAQPAQAAGVLAIDPATIQLESGYAYSVKVPTEWLPFASDHTDPERSTLVVEEDGVELAPGNAQLGTVQKAGKGAFLHWGTWLYFSSSDNTDPRSNGRKYRVVLAPE